MKETPMRLYSPEYYMEIRGLDVRLAVLKINDFLETLGDATISLIYADANEHENVDGFELKIIRRFHLRHAILDLNNCFDILLQIPWFYFRVWKHYNKKGDLSRFRNNRYKEVLRNTDGWVEKAEQNCNYFLLEKYLDKHGNELKDFRKLLKDFNKKYIINKKKEFTVRDLANQIKHRNSLKLKEFNEPYDFNMDINNIKINLKDNNLASKVRLQFYNKEDENNKEDEGIIALDYTDDLYVDIEYNSGEAFMAKDYLNKSKIYSMNDIYDELMAYRDELILLYTKLYQSIKENLTYNPCFNPTNIKMKSSDINLDRFFKVK